MLRKFIMRNHLPDLFAKRNEDKKSFRFSEIHSSCDEIEFEKRNLNKNAWKFTVLDFYMEVIIIIIRALQDSRCTKRRKVGVVFWI